MPLYDDNDDEFELYDFDDGEIPPRIKRKVKECWEGLHKIAVCRFEPNKENRLKEGKIHSFCLKGENGKKIEEPGQKLNENPNEVAQWIYSIAIGESYELKRSVECRVRFYSFNENGTVETKYVRFSTPEPSDEEEEDSEEEEDGEEEEEIEEETEEMEQKPKKIKRPSYQQPEIYQNTQPPQPIVEMTNHLIRNAESRQKEIKYKEEQLQSSVMELLNKRLEEIAKKEELFIEIMMEENKELRDHIKYTNDRYNQLTTSIIGSRETQAESQRLGHEAWVNGAKLQFELLNRENERVRRDAEKEIERIREESKRENRNKLIQSLAVPVITSFPQMLMSLAQMWKGVQGDMPPTGFAPSAGFPPPSNAPTTPSQPPSSSATPETKSNGVSNVATLVGYVDCHKKCNEVARSLSPTQRKQLKTELKEKINKSFIAWIESKTDDDCIINLRTLQNTAELEDYKIIDSILSKKQVDQLEAMLDSLPKDLPNMNQKQT